MAICCVTTSTWAAWLGQPRPTYVLSQPDQYSRTVWLNDVGGPVPGALWNPLAITGDGQGQLIVSDTTNRRVAIYDRYVNPDPAADWNRYPTWIRMNFQDSYATLGQPSYFHRTDWRKTPDARSTYAPCDASTDGEWIAVADSAMNRISLWHLPTINYQHSWLWWPPADIVLGQPDFNTILPNSTGTNASSLYSPLGVWTDGRKLAVADTYNHRVLLWDDLPVANGQPADRVLGQFDFASRLPNRGGAAAGPDTLSYPCSVFFDGTRLFVAELLNHRVLIFDAWPTQDAQSADRVWGQPGFTSRAANAGGVASASTLNGPRRVFAHASGVYVADSNNNRMLVWNDPTAPSWSPADQLFGQPDFATTSYGVGPNKFWYPAGVYVDREYLYIADTANHRVLCYYRAGTPPGVNVAIRSGGVTVRHSDVFLGGDTAITRSAQGPDPGPSFFPFGAQPWIQASRTSTDGGPITVEVAYDPAGLSASSEANLRLYRWLPDELRYVDVTPAGPDLLTRKLSVSFELVPKDWPPQPPAGSDPATWQPPAAEGLPGGGYVANTGELPLLLIGTAGQPSREVEVTIEPARWTIEGGRGQHDDDDDGDLDLEPDLEPRSEGRFRVRIQVPEGYLASDVDGASVRAAGLPVLKHRKSDKLKAKARNKEGAWYGLFDRSSVPIPDGAESLDLPVEGSFFDGQRFHGSATVRLHWPKKASRKK